MTDRLSPHLKEKVINGAPTFDDFIAGTGGETEHAFEPLFLHYYPRLVRFLTKLLDGSSVDPEDVAQDSLIKAWTNREQYDSRYQLSTWVYTIAKRTAMDRLRRVPVGGKQSSEQYASLEDVADPCEDPSTAMACQEDAENLWRIAEQKLSSSYYLVLWLRYGEEMSVAEVAKVLGKSSISVRVLLHRARTALKPNLQSELSGTYSEGECQQ